MERLDKIKYILEQPLYLDADSGRRAYSFNVKIHNLVLNDQEREIAYQLIQDENLNLALWQEMTDLMEIFVRENGIKAYTVGRRRGHLILKNYGDDGLPVYSEAELTEMPEEQLEQVFEVLQRFRKLFEDMFLVFKRHMSNLETA
jgi:hypothetical protein